MKSFRQHYRTTRPSMSGWALFLLTFIVLALLMGSAGHYLDRMDDNSHEWVDSDNLKALREAEEGSARRQAAAQALCNEARGPQSEARWLADGSLACTVRRGYAKAQVQL